MVAEKRLVIIAYLLFFLVSYINASTYTVTLNETFDGVPSMSASYGSSLNRTYSPTWQDQGDGTYIISKPASNWYNQTNTKITNGYMNYTGVSYPNPRFKVEICPQGYTCYFNNESRVSYNVYSTSHYMAYLGSLSASWGLGYGNANDSSFTPAGIMLMKDSIGSPQAACYKIVAPNGGYLFNNFTYQSVYNTAYNLGECGTQDNLDNWNRFNYIAFNWYMIDTSGHPTYYGLIDNITITNVLMTNGTNELPVINSFNLTSTDCINTSNSNSVDVYYNLDVDDPEGDTIYYSSNPSYQNTMTGLNFAPEQTVHLCRQFTFFGLFNLFEVCDNTKDFLDWIVPKGELSITIDSSPTFSQEGLCQVYSDGSNYTEYYTHLEPDVNGDQVYMLTMSPVCDIDNRLVYDTRDQVFDVRNFYFVSDYYWYNHVNQTWNVTFRTIYHPTDITNSIVGGFKFYQNETNNVQVYSMDQDLASTFIGSFSPDVGSNYAYMQLYFNYSTVTKQFTLNLTDTQMNTVLFNGTFTNSVLYPNIRFIVHEIDNTNMPNYLFISGFLFGGDVTEGGVWNTTVPTTITGVSEAVDEVCIYVTDETHINSTYNFACSSFTPQICGTTDVDSNTLAGNPIVTPLKNIFSPIIDGFDMRTVIENINWLVFLCLLVGLFIFIGSFGFAFIISSFFMLFLSLIGFGSTLQIITYGVLTAIALTPYVVQMIFPIQRGGG